MIWAIVIMTIGATAIYFVASPRRNARRIQAGTDRAERMNDQRDIISIADYRRQQQQLAGQQRCPRCQRAPGRPCVPRCRGRIDVDTSYRG